MQMELVKSMWLGDLVTSRLFGWIFALGWRTTAHHWVWLEKVYDVYYDKSFSFRKVNILQSGELFITSVGRSVQKRKRD